MVISTNVSNRYAGLQTVGSAKAVLTGGMSVSEQLCVADKDKEENKATKTADNIESSFMLKGYSYVPEIINDGGENNTRPKVSIVNGVCSDVDTAHKYLRELYFQKDDIDYSGMSGGEIITSIVDRYNQYFDCENYFDMTVDVDLQHIERSYLSVQDIYNDIIDEISNAVNKYGKNEEQAYSEYYGYENMSSEEKINKIVSEYADGGISFIECDKMLGKLRKTGAITGEEFRRAGSAVYQEYLNDTYNPNVNIDFEKILGHSYANINQDFSKTDMNEREIKYLINVSKIEIKVFESILNAIDILDEEIKDEENMKM